MLHFLRARRWDHLLPTVIVLEMARYGDVQSYVLEKLPGMAFTSSLKVAVCLRHWLGRREVGLENCATNFPSSRLPAFEGRRSLWHQTRGETTLNSPCYAYSLLAEYAYFLESSTHSQTLWFRDLCFYEAHVSGMTLTSYNYALLCSKSQKFFLTQDERGTRGFQAP